MKLSKKRKIFKWYLKEIFSMTPQELNKEYQEKFENHQLEEKEILICLINRQFDILFPERFT